jgi:hypothetical protein
MGQSPIYPTILVCSATLCGVFGMMENLAHAASASEKTAAQSLPTLAAPRHAVKPLASRKGHMSGPQTGMATKNKKLSDRQPRKALRGRKPMPAERVPEPMPGLAHHGVLKGPHRYHLNQGDRRSIVVTPYPGNLVHDHFLELDKNQDGVIDPLERAVGRLDLERDQNIR